MPLNNRFENLNSSDRFAAPGFFAGLFNTLKSIVFGDKEDTRGVGLLKYKGQISYKNSRSAKPAPQAVQPHPSRPFQTTPPGQPLQPLQPPPLPPQPLMQRQSSAATAASNRYGRIQPQKYTNKRI